MDTQLVIDKLDTRIIQMLEQDGRQNLMSMARPLHVSIHTVERRLERLIDNGAVRVMASVDPMKVGRPLYVAICLQMSPNTVQNAVDVLSRHPSVMVIQRTMGHYAIIINMWFYSTIELSHFLRVTLPKVPGVRTSETSIVLDIAKGRLTQLSPYFIESKDRDLISLLQENPRRSHSGMADILNISRATVGRRIDFLTGNGTVAIKALGPHLRNSMAVKAQLRIRAECTSVTTTIATLVAHPQVGWVGSCTGPFDVMAFVAARSTEEISDFIDTEINRVNGVLEVDYSLILELKSCYDLRHQEYWKRTNPPLRL